jgi:hypothetical protein
MYIARYAFPLFESARLSLNFGTRLPYPGDFLPFARGGEQAAATEFVARIAPFEKTTSSLCEPLEFARYVESLNSFRNLWVARGYALTLIVVGRTAQAAALLEEILRSDGMDGVRGFRDDTVSIARALSDSPETILSTLRKRALESRHALGLD